MRKLRAIRFGLFISCVCMFATVSFIYSQIVSFPPLAQAGVSFSLITTGTNTGAVMTVGSGASMTFSGAGTINASSLGGATFAAPGAIGGVTPGTAAFTTISATGQITSTLSTGTAPFVVASTTPVSNLNIGGNAATATSLASITGYSIYGSGTSAGQWVSPSGNGQCLMSAASSYATTTPSFQTCPNNSPSFSTLSGGTNTTAAMVVGTGSSIGFTGTGSINASTLNGNTFASPGTIGGTTAAASNFTTISASGQITSTLASGTAPFVVTSTTPVTNLSIGGNAATASQIAVITSYSVYGSGNTVGSWITPTANGQCMMSAPSSYATTTPSFQACSLAQTSASCTQATPCPSSATTLLATGAATAMYRADVSIDCTTQVSSATANVTITYTDPGGTVQTFSGAVPATCTTLGGASTANFTQPFRAENGTNIQYQVTTANSPHYQASVAIYQETAN